MRIPLPSIAGRSYNENEMLEGRIKHCAIPRSEGGKTPRSEEYIKKKLGMSTLH